MIAQIPKICYTRSKMNGSPPPPLVNVKEFLRPFLQGLAEEDLDELVQAAMVRSLPAGVDICREGEPGSTIYFIVQGRVEMVKRLDDDSERYLHDAGPGEIFGEMAIIQEEVRTATVRTTEPTTVLEIGREPFLTVLSRSPSLGLRILVRLTARLREADRQAIVELRRANEELTQALRRLKRLDRTKSDFIQVSAHELRTPVAALLGYAQMMQENPTVQRDPALRALAEGVVAGTRRLHRIFNSILDLSRVMTDGLHIRRSPVSIPVIFQGIHSQFERALEERDLTLELKGLKALPFCPADPDLLYKAFYHLVHNAIKYTPDGGRIRVTVRTLDVPDLGGECIEVAVEDTGIGIAPEDLDLIFEKFYRTGEVALHSSGTINFKGGGPGLGLAIAQGVVLAHGGRIWAESPGYDEETCPGSRFVVQLPLGRET
ncbi:MAG TPA: cyclic nucleotide-binding domain-containing protein [Anaerolineales bacterium]|nr:cyclic nucleotide-binding domain-containing protein [Anaerolineales bacterium]